MTDAQPTPENDRETEAARVRHLMALLAPGMLMGNARAHAWACFVVNIYFIQGVLAAIDPARALFGVLEAVISFGLFCTALLYTRWRFQYDRKLAGE